MVLPRVQSSAIIKHGSFKSTNKPIFIQITIIRSPNRSILSPSALGLHTSANTTRAASSNETDLLSGAGATAAGRRLTDVLVVASSVRVVHRVHAHAAHLRPLIALHSELVVRTARLQHRLVHAASASHDAHHSAAAAAQPLQTTAYLDGIVFLMPDGRRMNVMLRSSEWPITVT